MAEAAIAIAYPEPWNKGKAIGYWLTYRVSGQILGGAINLGLNASRNEAGKVSHTVYLVFIALQCLAPVVALFLTPPEKVQRQDRKKVELAIFNHPWFEIKATISLFFSRNFLLLLLLIGQAVYAEAVFFTYLSCEYIALHFCPCRILIKFDTPQYGFRSAPAHWGRFYPVLWPLSGAIFSA